jgi:hypothetical protein
MDQTFKAVAILALGLNSVLASAASPAAVPILNPISHHPLTPSIDLSSGTMRRASVGDILTPAGDASFVSWDHDRVHLGLQQESAWIRFDLANTSGEDQWVLAFDNPRLEYVALYDVTGGSARLVDTMGMRFPAHDRPFRYPSPAFLVHIPSGGSRTYYAMVQHAGSFRFQLQAWPLAAFEEHVAHWTLIHFLIVGALLIMSVHSLFIFVGLRERAYFLLALLILSFTCYQVSRRGIGYIYLWPHSLGWTTHASDVMGMFTLALVLLFTNAALNGRQMAPILARVVEAMAALALIAAVLCAGGWEHRFYFAHALGVALPFSVLPLAVKAWRQHYRPARYFLIAWGLVLGGSTVLGLLGPAILPSNVVTEHVMEATFLAAVILWSFALTDRVLLREELLERTVQERTAELKQAVMQVKSLRGLLPICCHCKKVRDDQGYWGQIEEYIQKHTDADLSHGFCPDCAREFYPGVFDEEGEISAPTR